MTILGYIRKLFSPPKEPEPTGMGLLMERWHCKNPEEEDDNFDPYERASWGDGWFCIRCGGKLMRIAKDDYYWGYLWKTMHLKGSLYYQCANNECCHASAPLCVHHPDSTRRGPGDSYSVSWIR